MAVEDHPLYPKWREALEHLIEAKERRDTARGSDRGAAKIEFARAQVAYRAIADEV